jgi:hypothetical protein
MSVFLLTSATHAPGVTTLAVALAAHATHSTLLIDANREPDQSTLAGYLRGTDPDGRDFGALLQAYRERRPLESVLNSLVLPMSERCGFLPGFAHPGMVSLFTPVWPELGAVLEADSRTVLVDAGRISTAGLPTPLISACSAVAVVTRTALPDLAALRLYLPQVLEAAGQERVGLVLVGPGRPYNGSEIRRQFEVPILAEIAWQPDEAAVYSAGAAPGRRHLASRYLRDVGDLARVLAERDTDRQSLIGVRR